MLEQFRHAAPRPDAIRGAQDGEVRDGSLSSNVWWWKALGHSRSTAGKGPRGGDAQHREQRRGAGGTAGDGGHAPGLDEGTTVGRCTPSKRGGGESAVR